MTKETLYAIADEYRFLYDFDFDESESEEWMQRMEELDSDIEDKADNIARIIQSNKANIEARKVEIKRLQELNKSDENKNVRLNTYLKENMEVTDKRKFKTPFFSFYIKKNPVSLDIESEEHITDDYYKIKKELDKKALLADIKEGLIIEGVHTKQTESLVIR